MELPLSVLITHPAESSQREFARKLICHLPETANLRAEVNDDGLTIRTLTDLDLERAVFEINQRHPEAKSSNPQVNYLGGPPLMEPYFLATLDVPIDALNDVVKDVLFRRGQVISVDSCPIGKRLKVHLPVAGCFGYTTTLRLLTRTLGKVGFEFLEYRIARRTGGGESDNA